MIYTLLLISAALLLIALVLMRRMRNAHGSDAQITKRAKYQLLRGSLEFLVPFTVAALVYSLLQLWVNHTAHSVDATTTIKTLEEKIRALRLNYVAPFKLNEFTQLALIVFIILLGYFYPRIARLGLLKNYKRSALYLTRAYILVTLLASFTFFGSQLNKSAAAHTVRLSAQINRIETGYAEYRAGLERVAEKIVAREIIEDETGKEFIRELTDAINSYILFRNIVRETELIVTAYPGADARNFDLEVDKLKKDLGDDGEPPEPTPSPTPKPPPPDEPGSNGDGGGGGGGDTPPSSPPRPEGSEDWTLAESERLNVELRELEQSLGSSEFANVNEIVEKSVDVVHDDVVKAAIINSLPESLASLQNLLDVGLDPTALYNFRDRVLQFMQNLFTATTRRGAVLRDAANVQLQSVRGQLRESAGRAWSEVGRGLKGAASRMRGKPAQAERVRRETPAEIKRKAYRQYQEQLVSFRESWHETYNFPWYDTSFASRALLSAIEKKLALIENPFEKIEALNDYSRSLDFSANRDSTLRAKRDSLVEFERARLDTGTFERNTRCWFQQDCGRVRVAKYCAHCDSPVHPNSMPGMTCPVCGVKWDIIRPGRQKQAEAEVEVEEPALVP